MSSRNHCLAQYLCAVTAIVAALFLREGLARLSGEGPLPIYITVYPAVMLSALLGGLGPGLFATAVAALGVDYFILPPVGSIAVASLSDAIGLAFFSGTGVFMSVVAELYRRSRQQAAALEEKLQPPDRPESPAPWSWSGWLLNAGFVGALAILAAAGWQSAQNLRAIAEGQNWETHTRVMVQELERLVSTLKDAEIGQRGFLLTGEERYLEPYEAALKLVQSDLASLKQLTRDNVAQQQRLTGLESLIGEKIAELKQTIALRRSRGLPAALEVVMTDKGKILMDQIRKRVTEAQDEEERLLREQATGNTVETNKVVQTLLAGEVLSFLLLTTVFLYLQQEIRRRRKAEADVRYQRDHLKEMVTDRTTELSRANDQLTEEIEEHRQAEKARAILAAIVESSEDAIISNNLGGTVTSWNAASERIFGYRACEIIGQPVNRIIPPELWAEEATILERLGRGQVIANYETVRLASDGRRVPVSLTISSILDDSGAMIGVSKIAHDITERKRLEASLQQAQKMETVVHLAGGVAHDFNNILTSTLLQLSLLQIDPSLPESTKISLRQIEAEAKRAAGLTRKLMLFSRQQAVQMKLLSLNAVLAGLNKMLRKSLGEAVSLHLQPGEDLLWVEADVSMLEEVVTILCLNAQDAMAPKGGNLTIGARLVELGAEASGMNPEARPGLFACLSVADTGCGMDVATLKRLFEPFFTTKEVGKGTGLGLSTVYGITKQHGGWVEVSSQVGQGSTFRVYLPALAKAPAVSPESPALEIRKGKEAILLVDDQEIVRHMVALSLKTYGYRVLEAASGPEAIQAWKDHRGEIDLLFTDMRMPNMTGMELFRRLRQEKATLKGIISSGYSEEFVRLQGEIDPQVTLLPKPYVLKTLAKTVRDCLDRADSLRESAHSE